jgi:hypothetical protein
MVVLFLPRFTARTLFLIECNAEKMAPVLQSFNSTLAFMAHKVLLEKGEDSSL